MIHNRPKLQKKFSAFDTSAYHSLQTLSALSMQLSDSLKLAHVARHHLALATPVLPYPVRALTVRGPARRVASSYPHSSI